MRKQLKTWRKEKMTAEKFGKIKGVLDFARQNPAVKNKRGGGIDYEKLASLAKTSAGVLRKIDITDTFEDYLKKQRTAHEKSLLKLTAPVAKEPEQADLSHVPTVEKTTGENRVRGSDEKLIDALYAIRAAIKEHNEVLTKLAQSQAQTNLSVAGSMSRIADYMRWLQEEIAPKNSEECEECDVK